MKPVAKQPLSPDAAKLVLEVSKQLITLSVAALGFLTSMLFTAFKGTPYTLSAEVSLFCFLLSAGAAVLAQLSVVAEAAGDRKWFQVSYPRLMLHLAWIFFVGALVALVVFTWANIRR